MPKVSFITTFYNAEKTIASSLSSMLNQTYQDIEVIAVDDGSSDNSSQIINGFSDSRIKLISEGKLGRAKALNKGLERARGEFIAILDADDLALPHRLERQVSFIESNPKLALVFSNVYLIDSKENLLGETHFPTQTEAITESLIKLNPFAHSSVLFRKAAAVQAGGYNDRCERSIDYNFYLELLLNGLQIGGTGESLTKLRVSEDSWGKSQGSTLQFFYGALGLFNYYQFQKSQVNLLRSPDDRYQKYYESFKSWYEALHINNFIYARHHAKLALNELKKGKPLEFIRHSRMSIKKYPYFWKLKSPAFSFPKDCEDFFKGKYED